LKGITIGSASGEYVQTQLGKRVEECTVFADVFKWWEPYNECATIVFAPRVKYARGLAEQFTQRGHVAEVIEAATTTRDRRDIFEAFNDGEVKVLVSVDVLREGFDAPIARVGIDLQPNNQLRSYWQKIGRIKRPHEGQETAVWLDFAGNIWKFPHPDEDPEWPSGQETTQDVIKKKRAEEEERKPWACSACSYVLSPWEQLINGECPQCGKKTTKPTRHIRMADGSMKTISAIDRKKKKVNQDQRIWDACRYKAHYSRKTLSFARWLFHEQTGRWPAKLKACPDQDSGDWKRRPIDVYPFMAKR
jgi:superfamily II DNA or RNA helicase